MLYGSEYRTSTGAVSLNDRFIKLRVIYLRGNFVIGIIAIQTAIAMESTLGYPSVKNIFCVISSLVLSPNISRPTTAILASSTYYVVNKYRKSG